MGFFFTNTIVTCKKDNANNLKLKTLKDSTFITYFYLLVNKKIYPSRDLEGKVSLQGSDIQCLFSF